MKACILERHMATLMFGLMMISGYLIGVPHARADIYYWTDVNGVIHFSNHNPPPEAEFFMVEQSRSDHHRTESETADGDVKSDPLKDQLEEANRKLEKALGKMDDLTEEVEKSRREARNAADAARQAQEEARIAGETRSERTVVYGVPYRHRPRSPHPKPAYWKHDTEKYPYYNGDRHRGPHRPNGKPDHDRPGKSGVSVKFDRNGTHVKGAFGYKNGERR